MKFLCPTDLSSCSINAIKWVLSYSKKVKEVEIEIIHCINSYGTLKMYEEIREYQKEKAIAFFDMFLEDVKEKHKHVTINYRIVLANPKTYIIEKANEYKPDYIVMGTTGLNNVKEITLGSVTEYVIDKGSFSVLCIPDHLVFTNLDNVAIGVDDKEIRNPGLVHSVTQFIKSYTSKVSIVQIRENKEHDFVYDQRIEEHFEDFDCESLSIDRNINIAHTMNEFASVNDIRLICFIHRKENWFKNMFRSSTVREGLFELEFPYLVISD